MHDGLIAKRYARAIYLFAAQQGEEQRLFEECRLLSRLYEEEPSIREVLQSPILPPQRKEEFLSSLIKEGASLAFRRLIALLLKRNRMGSLQRILMAYHRHYLEQKNLHPLTLSTAAPLPEALLRGICHRVEAQVGGEVILNLKVDSTLLGGFRLQVDDYLYDASIATRIRRLKQALEGPKHRIL